MRRYTSLPRLAFLFFARDLLAVGADGQGMPLTAGSVLLGALAVVLGPRWAMAAMGAAGAIAIVLVSVAMPKARHIR